MAHFAQLNNDNIVQQVIVISDDIVSDPAPDNEAAGQAFIADALGLAGTWKQTSYNGNFRGRYAGVGYTYDEQLDSFIPPQPADGVWEWDEDGGQWVEAVD